jgi:tetratricopeptide (TPR) repeat protein
MNSGAMWRSGPFIPEVSAEKNKGGSRWIDLLSEYVGVGMMVIAFWWLALLLAWLLCVAIKNMPDDNRASFRAIVVFWSVITLPIAAFVIFLGHSASSKSAFTGGEWLAGGFAACIWLLPIAHYAMPLLIKRRTTTFYSAAVARMKLGKPEQAEAEILKQLEQAEDDYDGWMMMAQLYAEHYHDLDTADQTVRDLCAQPGLNPGQVYMALSKLADWHLTLGDDPIAARSALEIVVKAYPGTHLGRMAQAKMGQIPRSRADLLEQRKGRTLRLPSLRDLDTPEAELPRAEAAAAANNCVNRLKADPDDIATREKLAWLFAEQLGRADMGIEQTKLMLEMPNQPENKRAEWLAQIGAWQLKHLQNKETGRRTLEQLIREYPNSPQAFTAVRRLGLLDVEIKFGIKSAQRKANSQ